jgi:hypothetical protein
MHTFSDSSFCGFSHPRSRNRVIPANAESSKCFSEHGLPKSTSGLDSRFRGND